MRQTARSAEHLKGSARTRAHENETMLEGEAILGHLEFRLDEDDPLDTARGFFNGVLIGAMLWLALAVTWFIAGA